VIWSARRRWPRDSIPRIYAGYCLERLVDEAARITGIDRIEIRCRNLIAPARMPYKTAVGTTYDSGDFATVFDEALASADVAGFGARQVSPNLAGAPSLRLDDHCGKLSVRAVDRDLQDDHASPYMDRDSNAGKSRPRSQARKIFVFDSIVVVRNSAGTLSPANVPRGHRRTPPARRHEHGRYY
jgi:hypothetical protein